MPVKESFRFCCSKSPTEFLEPKVWPDYRLTPNLLLNYPYSCPGFGKHEFLVGNFKRLFEF